MVNVCNINIAGRLADNDHPNVRCVRDLTGGQITRWRIAGLALASRRRGHVVG
jgi:hypothetical protein